MFQSLYVPVALLALVAAPITADAARAEPPNEAVQKSENEQLFDTFHDQLYAHDYAAALATASRISVETSNKSGNAIVTAMRAAAMLGLKRNKEAAALFAKAATIDPMESYVGTIHFDAALLNDNFDMAAAVLDRLIARSPDAVRDLAEDYVRYFLRNEPKGRDRENEDRRVALVRLGYGGNTELGDWLAYGAVGILVKRGDVADASQVLPYINEPDLIENLLIQKRYAALWPQLEALAGPRLEKIRASSVTAAELARAEAPDDPETLQLLANALRHSGRLEDAIALRAKLPTTREAMTSADEQLGWAVNNVALALHEAGRADEADKLFALLNEAPIKDDSWRVSMKINRLGLLVADGKFAQALPLVEPTAKVRGSPYAAQLVRRLRYCTLSGLGRKQEAATLLPELLKHGKDAPSATVEGLACAGKIEEAEKLALSSLKNDDFHGEFVRLLQIRPLTSEVPSLWSAGWGALRQRPAIASEFARLGRDLPNHLRVPSWNERNASPRQ